MESMERRTCLEVLLQEGSRIRVYSVVGSALPGRITAQSARVPVREGLAMIKGQNRVQLVWAKGRFSQYIRERDGFICHYCGLEGYTVDHVVPRSKGGRSTPANCVCACQTCNGLKADRNKEDFLAYVQGLACECVGDEWGVRRRCLRHRIETYAARRCGVGALVLARL